jgi:hypothetical protein
MADPGDLDRRLRRALSDLPEAGPDPGAKAALLGRLRRRRARRLQALAAVATAALVVAAAAYGLSTSPGPPRRAAVAGGAAAPSGQEGAVAPVRSAGATAGLSCAEVRVGGLPGICAGAYTSPSSAAATGAAAYAPEASAAAAAPEELAAGQSIEVVLPAARGLAWGAPRVEDSVAAGAPATTPVLRAVAPAPGRPAGQATASFVAARPGTAELVAEGRRGCAPGGGSCGATEVVWKVTVTVEGT